MRIFLALWLLLGIGAAQAQQPGTSVTLGASNVTLAFDKPVAYPSM